MIDLKNISFSRYNEFFSIPNTLLHNRNHLIHLENIPLFRCTDICFFVGISIAFRYNRFFIPKDFRKIAKQEKNPPQKIQFFRYFFFYTVFLIYRIPVNRIFSIPKTFGTGHNRNNLVHLENIPFFRYTNIWFSSCISIVFRYNYFLIPKTVGHNWKNYIFFGKPICFGNRNTLVKLKKLKKSTWKRYRFFRHTDRIPIFVSFIGISIIFQYIRLLIPKKQLKRKPFFWYNRFLIPKCTRKEYRFLRTTD